MQTSTLPLWQRLRFNISAEHLALGFSLFFALACNRMFWQSALAGQDLAQSQGLMFAAGLFVFLAATHFLLLSLLLTRWSYRPLLGLLCIATAFAVYFMEKYGIYLDPSMLRNALRTDYPEARELFAWDMAPYLLFFAVLPGMILSRATLIRPPLLKSTLRRTGYMVVALIILFGALALVFKDFSALMRTHKEMRYQITPINLVYSLAKVVSTDAHAATRERIPVGADAHLAESWQQRKRPTLLVIVVGETARAANWGLSGYARQTTPQLAGLDVLNFADVSSCGTNTEVSLPCMFSAIGRRNYDEERIRGSESLLHVLDRARVGVLWNDNQSGCKGVCDGLTQFRPEANRSPALCQGERCFDEALLDGLDERVALHPGNQVLVLHTLGNHGPAYYQRYPDRFRQFTPTCDTADLGKCSNEQIVNAYDNALLYTDHLLARTIEFLRRHAASHDTAMIYVSDHGESLGENKLYLHGVPYAIAPDVQKKVPMVMWLSPAYAANSAVNTGCLGERAKRPASHDNLFHTVLGMLDIRTRVYDPALDLLHTCRS
ncbi:MAG: phosphoethanolamine--lipid A transferase [Rhodocyclaceae bacterium]|nr:phosphoethanolamine--lipid A transferase [Rhodocyclaceae bacterium]